MSASKATSSTRGLNFVNEEVIQHAYAGDSVYLLQVDGFLNLGQLHAIIYQ